MDKHKFKQEEMQLVEDTALTAAEIDHYHRAGKSNVTVLDHNEAVDIVRAQVNKRKEPMKEHKVVYGRIQLLKTQLRTLRDACEHAIAKFDEEELMSSTVPYYFHVTEKEVRFQLNLLEYRYLSAKHTLVDIKDEVVNEGTEVNHGKK